MTEYNIAFDTNASIPADPRSCSYPLRQTGYWEGILGSGGTQYIEPSYQGITGLKISWLIVDRCEINGCVQCSGTFGGCSLYIYVSPDGSNFAQSHILYFPGNTNITPFCGIELAGLAAQFRLHSGVGANTIRAYLNLRAV